MTYQAIKSMIEAENKVDELEEQLAELGFSHKYLTRLEKSDIETASNEQAMETAIVRRGRKPKALDGDS
jgi:hypothetical protein